MRRALLWIGAACCLLPGPAVISAQERTLIGQPPNPAAITLSEPDDEGQITLIGDTNAAPSSAYLAIRNQHTGETVTVQAGLTGQFFAQIGGTWGTPFLISPSETRFTQTSFPGSLPGGPAAFVTAPMPDPDDPLVFSQQGSIDGAVWTLDGVFSTAEPGPDAPLELSARVTLDDDLLGDEPGARVCARISLMTIAALDTSEDAARLLAVNAPDAQNGWSAARTASGMGIVGAAPPLTWAEACGTTGSEGQTASLFIAGGLPAGLPPGLHVPMLAVEVQAGALSAASEAGRIPVVLRTGVSPELAAEMPVALLYDDPSNGARGLMPSDGPFTLANRVRLNSETYTLPPGSYSLAPYLMNMLPNRFDTFAPPLVPLDDAQGEISVRVTAPDGRVTALGGPLSGSRVGTVLQNDAVLFGRQSPVDLYQMLAADRLLSAFPFVQYGPYSIDYTVSFADIFGNRYTGGGDVSLTIAEPLIISPALLAGAPLEASYPVSADAHLTPAVPAQVEVALVRTALDGRERIVELTGTANPFGIYSAPPDPFASALEAQGEYRLRYTARYTDAQGRLWHGEWTGAGVIVAPDSALVGHGARGTAGSASDAPAWFLASGLEPAQAADSDNLVLNFPYFSGDMAFTGADQGDGLLPAISLQDGRGLSGTFAGAALRAGVDPADVWRGQAQPVGPGSYTYTSAVTAGVSVRQFARGGHGTIADGLPLFSDGDDPLNGQPGAGFEGLRGGDLIFLFGGAVQRDPDAGTAYTAGYAASAMTIVTAPDDPPRDALGIRVLPAGTDAAYLRVGSVEYPAAIVPLGARPGDVLLAGENISLAGQIAPALPALVDAVVTAPDGTQTSLTVQANTWGAFAFTGGIPAEQPGIWTVHLRASIDETRSSGALDVPVTGTVVGALEDTFSVYVVPDAASLIAWPDALVDIAIPPGIPYNLNIVIPGTWQEFSAHRTLGAPGLIVAQGDIRLTGRSLNQQYNPTDINRAYSQIESESRITGAAASDRITITLFIEGVDPDGAQQFQARVFSFLHDRLISLP